MDTYGGHGISKGLIMWNDFLDLIIDVLLWLPRKIYEYTADAIIYFINLVPDDSLDVQGTLNGWSGDILYFLTLFQIQYAVTALFTALIARFILRRIPVIG